MAETQTTAQFLERTQALVKQIKGLRERLPDDLKEASRRVWRYRFLMFFALVVVTVAATSIGPDPTPSFWQGFFSSVCFMSAVWDLVPAELHLHRIRSIDKQSEADLRKYLDLLRELQKATTADELERTQQ